LIPYLLITGDFVTTGGMDRANHALASFLARQGNPVHLVAHRVADDLLSLPNIHFHRVPKPVGSYALGQPLLDRAGRGWARLLAVEGGRTVVNGGNCRVGDVNWVHYVHAAYDPVQGGGPLRRLKRAWDHRRALRTERQVLTQARLIIANSQRTRADLVERLGLAPERIRVVYYGVDPEQFRPADPERKALLRQRFGWPLNRTIVVFVGALGDRRKGFDTLFAAWLLLCRVPDWTAELVVVGAGGELPAWRRRTLDAGLGERIRFLGFRRDVPDLLAAADLLVAPTRYEAYGLNVQEALCCAIPALVGRTAGVAERFPKELAPLLLDDPTTPADLADRLRNFAAAPERLRAEVGKFAATLRTTTWDDMAHRIRALTEPARADRPAAGSAVHV
jgi:glycosyltransferase involved in cell wall biosynthesis